MAIAPYLALNSRTGASPQLQRFVNATPTGVGVTIHGAVSDIDGFGADYPRGYPPVIKFGGSQTFVLTVGAGIFRSTDGGATWTQVKDLTSYLSGGFTASKSGLWVLNVSGVATAVLVTSVNGGPSSYYAHKSTDGVTWTTVGPFAGNRSNAGEPNDFVVWDGKLVVLWTDTTNEVATSSTYDPAADTMTFAAVGSFGGADFGSGSSLCVFNNRLFAVVRSYGGANSTRIIELVAGTWGTINAFTTSGSSNEFSKSAMFVDGAFLYCFLTFGGAWKCYQWSSAMGAPTDISSAVIPTALASGMTAAARMSVIVDDRGTPGTAPTIWLFQSVDGTAASALNEWKWNGPSSFIGTLPGSANSGPNDSGGSTRFNLPWVKNAQGATFWTSGEDFLQFAGFAPTPGGITASFKLYSDGTTIAFDSDGASLPQATIFVPSATGFPATGSLYVQTNAGRQTVAYTGVTNLATTVAAGSNGVNVSTFVGAGTLNVADTTGFPSSGTVAVITDGGLRFVAYTGTTGTSFTGCTTVGAVLTGVLYTSGAVTMAKFTGCTGGTGAMSTGNAVTQAVDGSVRGWQGTADDAYPLTAATLTGTTTGLPMDNFTTHSVDWQAQTDGFTAGERAKFVMEKY